MFKVHFLKWTTKGEVTLYVPADQRQHFYQYLLSLQDNKKIPPLSVLIKKWYPPKTDLQVGFYRRMCRAIATWTHQDENLVHDGIKARAIELFGYPHETINDKTYAHSSALDDTHTLGMLIDTAWIIMSEEQDCDPGQFDKEYREYKEQNNG